MGSLEKEEKRKVELIHLALHQLIEERREDKEKGNNDIEEEEKREEESLLLSKLLSKLDTIEKNEDTNHSTKCPLEKEEPSSSSTTEARDYGTNERESDEIIGELRRIKTQNLITHCLLSVMIVVTAVWQFNEVSLVLTVKEKLRDPLKAVGDFLKDSLKGLGKNPAIEASPLPPISVPELQRIDLPSISLNGNEDQ